VLLGAYQANVGLAVVASLGIIAATLYGLRITAEVFQGPNRHGWRLPDLFPREWVIVGCMMAGLLWLGVYPQSFIGIFRDGSARPVQTIASVQESAR